MSTLSVVITAYNEEAKITGALESVKELADEIIVVDNASSDKTASIAKRYTKKVYSQKNDPEDIDRQKNFGFSKATKVWTLSLDADERVTPELAEEIRSIVNNQSSIVNKAAAYWIPRKNIIFGKWIEHTGWYPDFQLRLFKTGKGKYVKQRYHEPIGVDGESEYLHTDLIHKNYQTVVQFLSRNLLVYAKNEAQAKIQEGYAFSYLDSMRFPAKEFVSRFFSREGYKDGLHGLVLSILMAIYHFTIFLYIWEDAKFPQGKISLTEFANETNKIAGETNYWVLTSKIQNEKNPIKKIGFKFKRKLK